MAINHNIDVVANGFTHFGNTRLGGLNRLEPFDVHRRRNGHRLKRGKTFRHSLPRELGELSRVVDWRVVEMLHFSATQVTIEADIVANRPAPKFVTWNAV